MSYHPAKYHHIGQEELFIDHQEERSFWSKLKQQMLQSAELLDARLRILFDKQARTAYRSRMIRQQLRDVGLSGLDLLKPETHHIAKLLHKNEKILGAIVGHLEEGGSALLVITNLRIIFLNQIPLFTNIDEMKYEAVNAVSADIGRWSAVVTLYTEVGDFIFHSVTLDAASRFVESVEKASIDEKAKTN